MAASKMAASKMAVSKMAVSKMAFHFCIASKHHFVSVVTLNQPLYWKGNKDNSRFTTRYPTRIHYPGGRWHPHVCKFGTERLVH